MSVQDARINTSFPLHPKTKKLIRRLGQQAGWNLVCLFLWAAANRSGGDLAGMTDEDIELAADWNGEQGLFVEVLAAVRFLDGGATSYQLHDWAEHNPWAAGAEARSLKARWNAAKRHYGEAEADRLVPNYRLTSSPLSTPVSNAASTRALPTGNAPSPSPSPCPSPNQKPIERQAARFPEFWAEYPIKKGRTEALAKWTSRKLDLIADRIIADVKSRKVGDRQWLEGYIPHGSTYVCGRVWEDEIENPRNGSYAASDAFAVAR